MLGTWKNWTKKEIPLKYLTVSDHLDILGVKLFGNFIETRAKNGEILIKKINDLINVWKSGKFMPLLDRPTSINTYALSKIWYRAASINFKVGDIDNMQSKIKSWLNQDTFEKPQEEILYRKKEDGGLNLTNIKFKMKAYLITNFLQTACNDEFKQNLYHNSLYEYYINGIGLKAPPIPPTSLKNLLMK